MQLQEFLSQISNGASQIILIILGIAIVVILLVALLTRKGRETAVGICATAIGLDAKKRERKEKILKLLEEVKNKSLTASGSLPLEKG